LLVACSYEHFQTTTFFLSKQSHQIMLALFLTAELNG
jgi:hypothetical protein